MHVETIEASSELHRSMEHGTVQVNLLEQGLASLQFPFLAGKNNEELSDVVWRSRAFLQRYRLLQNDALASFDLPDIVRYATLLYPIAEDTALDIAVDAITWSNVWRGEYQRLCQTDAPAANMVIWQLVDLTLHRVGIQPADDAPPLVWAFANLWKREAAGMSLSWQQRAATNWRRWFLCFAGDNVLAELQGETNLSTHLPDRHSTECAVLGDLIEGSLKYELPRGAYESLEIEGLRDIQADSMRWVSDIAAARAGNPPEDNVVRAVQRQWGISPDQAISKVVSMHEKLMQRWCGLRSRLPQLYVTLRLSEEARIHLQRYVIGIELLIAGHHAWYARAV
ncbi:hypothetical protein ACFONN_12605 [Dyella humi]|uniref:Uncharacterized protein n=1 Tax=Dyella humi TaxID=1770547 RepID=A0ABW8IM80_9GAMM